MMTKYSKMLIVMAGLAMCTLGWAEEFSVKDPYRTEKKFDIDISSLAGDKEIAMKVTEALIDEEFDNARKKGTGNEVVYKLRSATKKAEIWNIGYNWEYKGVAERGNAMGHTFDAKIDVKNRTVLSVSRCK